VAVRTFPQFVHCVGGGIDESWTPAVEFRSSTAAATALIALSKETSVAPIGHTSRTLRLS
jgi:hypothetical protein